MLVYRLTVIFQSTLSVGRATAELVLKELDELISIHALRGESDAYVIPLLITPLYFNPRSPWGERQLIIQYPLPRIDISIHALRGESDVSTMPSLTPLRHFNPRSPWGERLFENGGNIMTKEFQSTLSVGRATMLKDV